MISVASLYQANSQISVWMYYAYSPKFVHCVLHLTPMRCWFGELAWFSGLLALQFQVWCNDQIFCRDQRSESLWRFSFIVCIVFLALTD